MNILITGATGAIGPNVVLALHQAGHQIRTFSVDAPAAGMFPQDVEVLSGDITDIPAVRSAMQGMDAVVHMAALLHIVNPQPEMRARYEHINIRGTETVVGAAVHGGVGRIVLFSTIAVYGPSCGQVLDEMSPANPDTMYAQTKRAAERIVLEAMGAGDQPLGTVLRLGAVYGSRIKGNYERLVRALARQRFLPVGAGCNRRTLVYDKDVARAAVLAVSHPAAAGRIFNVTDGQYYTLNEIIQSICTALGRTPPRWSLPLAPTRSAIKIIEKVCRFFGYKPPVTQESLDKYTEDIAVDGNLIQRELGFVPQYDLHAGWEDALREMRR